MSHAAAAAGAGFLLAVLWFDLMFDVQVLARREGSLPAPALASIRGYYRRVTTGAAPMNMLVSLAMAATLGALAWGIARDAGSPLAWASLALALSAIGLAGARTVRNARRLGAGGDPLDVQAGLARKIWRDHVFCFAAMSGVLALQLASAL